MRGPIFLKTATGFFLKSFDLEPGSSLLAWSGDDGSSGSIDLMNVTEITLPDKNSSLRIHLVMSDGTTQKLLLGNSEAREQWTQQIQSICHENWSNLEIAAIATRFDFSTSFVQFCSLWFKSYHGDGSLSVLEAKKIMQAIASTSTHQTIGVNAFLDVLRAFSPPSALSPASERVPMEGVFEWISAMAELGHYGIAELSSIQLSETLSLEDSVEALRVSCSRAAAEDISWLGELLSVREAFRCSDEGTIAAVVSGGALFPVLAGLLKEHSASTGSMFSLFVVVCVLECLQFAFSFAASLCSGHAAVLTKVAVLSLRGAFYSACALDILSLTALETSHTRNKALNALSAAAESCGKTVSTALVGSLVCGLDCCASSVLMLCTSIIKSAPGLAERELFAQSLYNAPTPSNNAVFVL